MPEFGQRYAAPADRVFKTAPEDIAADFPSQARIASYSVVCHYSLVIIPSVVIP